MSCHLAARVHGIESLDGEQAAYVWEALRRGFPEALAAVILPDHLHLVPSTGRPASCRQHLAAVLSGVTRHWLRRMPGGVTEWRLAPAREPHSNRDHLARDIRYLALNPCRAGLVVDPLEWLWTTHRDVVGAVADPWVTAARVAEALGRPPGGFARQHHAYVSADPSVRVDGTRLPRSVVPGALTALGPERLCAAALAATRSPAAALHCRSRARSLLVHLAYRYGWRRPSSLAEVCHMSTQAVYVSRDAQLDRGVLEAAELCLGDDRLLRATARDAASACAVLRQKRLVVGVSR